MSLIGYAFLLLVSNAIPAGALTLDAPNSGAYLTSGSKFAVRWSKPDRANRFSLWYSRDGGKRWTSIATKVQGAQFTWKVPVVERNETNCLVRVESYRSGKILTRDRSDKKFSILATIVAEPNGEETLMPGQVADVSWKTFITRWPVATVDLSFTTDGGRTWQLLTDALAGNPGTIVGPSPRSPGSTPPAESRSSSGIGCARRLPPT